MVDNPYAQYANPYAVYGTPRVPPPQTPDQATGQSLQNQHTQLENSNLPLQGTNTRVNIEQGKASIDQTRTNIKNTQFDNVNNLRKQFEAEQPIQDYKTVVPLMDSAIKAQNNKAGDLNIVYAFGKVMDPNSVVREGEQVMATNVGGVSEKVKGYIDQINGQGQLTPNQRTQLIEEIRSRARALQDTYNQRRAFYEDFAKRNHINPLDVVGPHPGVPFQTDEAAYISAHGGTPHDPNAPTVVAGQTQQGFDLHSDPRNTALSPEQAAAYDAWWKANPNATPEQLKAFGATLNIPIGNAEQIVAAKRRSGQISHGLQYKPDITDVRGGNNTPGQDTINATARGVADTVGMGAIDKEVALADTVFKGGTFDQNLARQYAISDYDQHNHPFARLGGEALGGAVLPMGEVGSLGNLSLKGAAYGGAYGLGSSRQLSDIPANVAGGSAVGAAVPAVVGKFFHLKMGGIDPLVDPVTGELNVPMDSMTPAERAAVMQSYGMKTITPGMAGGRSARIMEQAFNNLPGSAGHMEDVNAAASGELRRSMQGVAQQFGTSKTLNEGGAELQRGANEYINRSQAVTARAYSAIPIADKAQASTANTVATLGDLTSRFESNPDLAAAFQDKSLAGYAAALQKGTISWKDLKDFRSIIGEKIGQMRFGEGSSTSDLRALYAGLSQDMQDTAAAQGPRAVSAFNRANNLYRQQQQLIEGSLARILGPGGNLAPEKAAAAVQAMTKGGKSTGDLRTLAQIKAATVKSGAWDEIASTLIHLGGQPANSEGRAFQPQTFVQWYSDMAEPARRMLFKPELRKSLDGFVAMTQQLGRLKGLANTSNTSPNVVGSGILMTAAASLMDPILGLKLGGTLAGNYAMGKVWTSPAFVKLITGYGRAAMTGNRNAVQSQVGRLAKFAATNPEFSEPVQMILRQIANDNAPAAGSVVASPDQGPQGQAQPQ